MAYQTLLAVGQAIRDIDVGKYFLPPIQRKFVRDNEQIKKYSTVL